MKIIDISWPVIENMPEYEGRKILDFKKYGQETKITLINHTGTHVDGPAYFFNNAKKINEFKLNQLIGKCVVLDLTKVKTKITDKDLSKYKIKPGTIVLFKTKNSSLPEDKWYDNFIYLDLSGAQYLVKKKVKTIGTDYLALEANPNFPSHKILLKKNILIIEGLRLKNVKAKEYNIYCLPIKLIGLDAAISRAILINQ